MDPAKLKVVELRAELSKRGLDTKGNKAVLVERLREALDGESGNEPSETVESSPEVEDEPEATPEPPKPSKTPSRSVRSTRHQEQSQEQDTPVPRTPTRGTRASARAVTPDKKPPVKSPVVEKAHELPTIAETPGEEASPQKEEPTTKKSQKKPEESSAPETTEKSHESPVKQAVNVSPAKVTQDLKTSPVKPAQTAVSPAKQAEIIQKSPSKPIQESQQSPAKPVQAAQLSPTKSPQAVQQSPTKPVQAAQQSPAKIVQATVSSPVKSTPVAQQSPVKPAQVTEQSPVKSPQVAQQSPVKSAQESPVKTYLASPKSVQQTSPVKSEQDKSPAKTEQQKSPVKTEQQKSPVKAEQQKSPVKVELQKSPVKTEQQKSPVKTELQKSPVKTEQQKSPVKAEQQKSPVKAEQQKSPIKAEEQKSPVKDDKSPVKLPKETEEKPVDSQKESEFAEDIEMKDDDDENPGSYAHLITSEEDVKDTDKNFDEEMDSSDKYDHEMELKDDNVKEQEEDTKLKEGDRRSDKTTESKSERKRKRSLSPEDDSGKASITIIPEDEPEMEENTVALSWYDSDLNLIIEKGFFSATPMHSDGFGYVWAGARATYGFRTGKVFYEVKITENCQITLQDEENPHLLRAGWSVIGTSMQLGEEALSFGFDGSGKKSTNNEFSDYGESFNKDDVVGCYLDMSQDNVEISYTLNGNSLGTAFSISKEELGDKALYPHLLSKNCSFMCNFGQEEPWSDPVLEGYVFTGKVDVSDRVIGPQRPEKKEDCEMLMLCGLPGSGKTHWSLKYAAEHPEKMYNILGTNTLIEKMKIMGLPRKTSHQGKWEVVIDKCSRALTKLMDVAARRRRNYILDQNNVYLTAQKRKMRHFQGFQRKAIVVIPSDEEYQTRSANPDYVEYKASDNTIQEMKANFTAPVVGESFDAVEYVELSEEEAKNVIEKYNKDAKEAGFGQQHEKKRSRFEKADHRDGRSRDNRDNRDRDNRRSGYSDRNRNSAWRGGGSSGGGWRDRNQRGGHMRYGGPNNWRGRGGSGAVVQHSRGDRRGNDRRSSNDRNRSSSRSGGWGQVGYQGSQSSGNWGGQQGSWSGQSGWNQQGGSGWGGGQQQWGNNWKGYGQGYSQSSYNQSGYGNGNWNNSNWNQQYYNQQYWGQNQPSGQTTTASSQATNSSVTSSSTKHTDDTY